MRHFYIDNTPFDGRVYSASGYCAICNKSIMDPTFYKDKKWHNMPFYFQVLNVIKTGEEPNAVMFCGPEHSNDWSKDNKDKVWDKK